jgi:pantothenate kinase
VQTTAVDIPIERAIALASTGRRALLGICGPPGAGKSTVGSAVVTALVGRAVGVPMDGYHLAQSELQRLGLTECKGAPETLDRAGFAALLRRLRTEESVVYAPEFRREIEEPVAGAIAVSAEVPLVVVEGNYLLLWPEIAELLDEIWYLRIDDSLRLARLTARHAAYGRSDAEARRWAEGSDQGNAEVIRATAFRADVFVDVA